MDDFKILLLFVTLLLIAVYALFNGYMICMCFTHQTERHCFSWWYDLAVKNFFHLDIGRILLLYIILLPFTISLYIWRILKIKPFEVFTKKKEKENKNEFYNHRGGDFPD